MKMSSSLHNKALAALKEAVKGVIENHKRTGRPLAIWENGKVKWVSAKSLSRIPKK